MEENTIEEKAQKHVLTAIMKLKGCENLNSALRFASMNYSMYEVAMEAVRTAIKECEV